MTAPLEPWQIAWMKAARERDPFAFVTGVVGVLPYGVDNPNGLAQLELWQETAFKALRDGKKRISIRSGHGCGKTAFLAWLVLYGLLCLGPDTKIPIAAGSRDQLRDTIQPEIGKWARRLPQPLQDQIKVDIERVAVRAAPDDAFAVFRTASKDNPQALAGFHAENIIFLLDEASAIAEIAFEVALGALSTPGAIVIMTGNPTKTQGFFYDSHHKTRDRWFTMRVSSEDVPRARGHIEDVIANYGRDSNRYRVRVLGEFPTQDDETVIPLDLVLASRGRDVATSDVFPVMGVDVARFGDDTSAIVLRQGNTLLAIKEWRQLDGAQLSGRIQRFCADLPVHLRPREIVVDVIGVGASVYDILRLPGSELAEIVRGCNVSEMPSRSELDHRLRDELWFAGRAWFAERNCHIPQGFTDPADTPLIEKLISELTAPTYDFTSLGKRKVESKADMKERGVPSPNLADAFLLSLAAGIYPKSNPHSRRNREKPLSWLAA
jgi:phage terminase large subunit